jgi:hypothetical protein
MATSSHSSVSLDIKFNLSLASSGLQEKTTTNITIDKKFRIGQKLRFEHFDP